MQKAFKLTIHSDQQVISKKTMPEAMEEAYKACDPVPDLHLLSKFRHDNKDSLKFYTDPDYFFELWKEKMSAEFEKRRKKRVSFHSKHTVYFPSFTFYMLYCGLIIALIRI